MKDRTGDGAGRDPGEPDLVIVPDAETASALAAERIAAALIDAVAARGVAHWSTTGGSTPSAIYRRLAAPPFRESVPWASVHLWWGDDRWVPEDNILSNVLACRDLLLGDVPVPEDQVHLIPIGAAMAGGHSPAWAAARYAAELVAAGLPVGDAGFPVLDIVLVGIGSDGHLFSVFPGSATWDDQAWVQPVPAPSHIAPHVERITLHPRLLDAARLPLAVAHGAAKAAIIGRLFGRRGDERELPALLARRAGALWILDEAAAAEIPAEIPAELRGTMGRGERRVSAPDGRGGTAPDRLIRSADGTAIAVFESGSAEPGTRPLILVHGTTADHLTFRVVGPLLGRRRSLHAIDRRGRGASGDRPVYAIERELEDVAAVAEALASEHDGPVDVLGHSFGGRCALGAALLTPAIRRVVCYEGAPGAAGHPYRPPDLPDRLQAHLDDGDLEALLEAFMREVVGLDDWGMARFRADPVWPLRVAAAPTILRELWAEQAPAVSLDALGRVTLPVLQVLGTESVPAFRAATVALGDRLAQGSLVRIEGAAHAAHHTHPDAFVAAVEAFLDAPAPPAG